MWPIDQEYFKDKEFYKAVRLDRTSHYDGKTKWPDAGGILTIDKPTPTTKYDPCGRGIHCSPDILSAISYQRGPSDYCLVRPARVLAFDEVGNFGRPKARATSVQVIRWLPQAEQDAAAGFKLYEANHPFQPLSHRQDKGFREGPGLTDLKKWDSVRASVGDSVRASVGDSVRASVWASVRASVRDSVGTSVGTSVGASVWASVWASVRASVGDSVRASVWASVWASVGDSVWDSVWASVWASVRDSVWDSVWAYIGGLFPNIETWKYAEKLGADPWRPLLDLWYAGYVPSFDGTTWRIHAGPKAEVVFSITRTDLSKL